MAMFTLPAQIGFLSYPDCIQIEFRKSGKLKKKHTKWDFCISIQTTFGWGFKIQFISDFYTVSVWILISEYQTVFCVTCTATQNADVYHIHATAEQNRWCFYQTSKQDREQQSVESLWNKLFALWLVERLFGEQMINRASLLESDLHCMPSVC